MTVTWKNVSVILVVLAGVLGYAVRFEVLAYDVKRSRTRVDRMEVRLKGVRLTLCRIALHLKIADGPRACIGEDE